MLEIKNAWSRTSADRSCDSSTGMSCYQFGIQPPSSHWTQNDHCTEGMATTKAEICYSPTARSLLFPSTRNPRQISSSCLQTENILRDKIHQKEEYWAIEALGMDICQHECSIAKALGKILWHGLFLERGSGHYVSWWQSFEFWHLPQYSKKKMSGMFTIEKMFKRNLRPRRRLV